MRPNSVTCSIILKSLAGHSAGADIRRAKPRCPVFSLAVSKAGDESSFKAGDESSCTAGDESSCKAGEVVCLTLSQRFVFDSLTLRGAQPLSQTF